ncbi:MAG TPA: 3-dehydroquinate synthase [Gammaproteobacteria bacterium]|nr:3-dehydroquinate synthase [Gammaproteobacteria bacterium]
MKKLLINIPAAATHSYPILINSGLLEQPEAFLPENRNFGNLVLVTDNTVKKLYAERFAEKLIGLGYKVTLLAFPAGEQHKNYQTKQHLETRMLRHRFGRDSLCLALGGGVVGDLTGFAASTYMRGIPYVQIPTTLLAMVDSSVGGKTGIDTPQGKNLIGAFWQPQAVVADINCLKTLPKKHLINGLIEALKMFLTSDAESLVYAQAKLDKILAGDETVLKNLIYRAVKVKADVVAKDEKENNLRMILNFGHTIGHAVETLSQYKILHGYAVALGILVEAKIAQLLGLLDFDKYLLIYNLFTGLGIVTSGLKKYTINHIINATKLDKKVRNGAVNYVLLRDIGQVYENKKAFAHPVEDDIVVRALIEVMQ